jgi:hypothetical protein
MPLILRIGASLLSDGPAFGASGRQNVGVKLLILEDNLMWAPRLANGAKQAGWEPVILDQLPPELPTADAAIVNLASAKIPAAEAIARLREAGVYSIAHAGHKEKPLLEVGRDSGADRVVSNGALSSRLGEILNDAAGKISVSRSSADRAK